MSTMYAPLKASKKIGTVPHIENPAAEVERIIKEPVPKPLTIYIGRNSKPAKIETIIDVVVIILCIDRADLGAKTRQ